MSWRDTGYGRSGYRGESGFRARTDEEERAEGARRRAIESLEETLRLKQYLRDPWEIRSTDRLRPAPHPVWHTETPVLDAPEDL